jgi:hypothetical protein
MEVVKSHRCKHQSRTFPLPNSRSPPFLSTPPTRHRHPHLLKSQRVSMAKHPTPGRFHVRVRLFTVVPRQNIRRSPAPVSENIGVQFPGLPHDVPTMEDFARPDGDIIVITIPLDIERPVASTRKSRVENWIETEKILTDVLYHGGQRNRCMCSRAPDRKLHVIFGEDLTTALPRLDEEVRLESCSMSLMLY